MIFHNNKKETQHWINLVPSALIGMTKEKRTSYLYSAKSPALTFSLMMGRFEAKRIIKFKKYNS